MEYKTVYLPVFGDCECVVVDGKVISVYQIKEQTQLVTDSDNGAAADAICSLAEHAISEGGAVVIDMILDACRIRVIDEFVLENVMNSWVHEQECATAACGGKNGN